MSTAAVTSEITGRLLPQPHLHRRLADELLLVPVEPTGHLPIRLNATGTRIWDQLAAGRTIEQIADDGDPATERSVRLADATNLAFQLVELGLLRIDLTDTWAPGEFSLSVEKSPLRTAPDIEPLHAPSIADLWLLLQTFGRSAGSTAPLRLADIGPAADVIDAVEVGGGIGQLAYAIDLGWVDATARDRDLVQERWAANQLHCLRVEQMLLQAVRLLDGAGVPHRILKGVAVAHLDHADPSLREFGDADILVPADRYDDATAALRSDGSPFTPLFQDMTHPFAVDKGCTYLTAERLILDVHRQVTVGGLGAYGAAPYFDTPEAFELGGATLHAAPKHARLLHASVHWYASKAIRPGTWRDFTELADVSTAKLQEFAAALRLTGVMRATAEKMGSQLSLPILQGHAAHLQPRAVERLLVRHGRERPFVRDVFWREATGLLLTPGVRNRYRYAKTRLVPNAEFRAAYGISPGTYLRVLRGGER
jgi:hypothetical protein